MYKRLQRLPILGFIVLSFTSCGSIHIYNYVPTVASNPKNFVEVQDHISSSPRYINGLELRFIYNENYNDTELAYKIFDQKRNIVQSSTDIPVNTKYGLNKIILPLTTIAAEFGMYVLEITNKKGVKKYVTFIKSLPI